MNCNNTCLGKSVLLKVYEVLHHRRNIALLQWKGHRDLQDKNKL